MMDPDAAKPVRFTYDSDREIVRFIFYRVCFGMLHSFLPDEWAKAGPGGALPSPKQVAAAEQLQVGTGDPSREYYLYVAVAYPAVAAGDVQGAHAHAELLHKLASTTLACESTWLVRAFALRTPPHCGLEESHNMPVFLAGPQALPCLRE